MTLQASSAGDGHLSGLAGALVDESLVGLLLLDSRGAVVETNQRGRDVLSAAGGLRVRRGRLCAHRPQDAAGLDAALDRTAKPKAWPSTTVGGWPDQRPLTGVGLRIVLVLAPEHMARAVAEELAREVDFLVIHDSKGDLGRALGLEPHTAHGFLVDPGERLALSSRGLPRRDELRQHVEKHLLGEIQYAASPVSLLGPGALLPEYEVVGVGEGSGSEVVSYAPASGAVVVAFAAALCSACGPDEAYDQLALLYRSKCQSSAECPVELLVTAGFPTANLLSSLQARGVERLPIYRAKGTLAGLEDEYFTKRRSDAAEALVLTMGEGGKVLAVSSLTRAVEVSHVR